MSEKRKSKRGNYVIEELGEYSPSPEEAADIESRISAAEKEIEETRINFRWGVEQLAVVKAAAEKMGLPYQIYMKHVLYKQAVSDLLSAKSAERCVASNSPTSAKQP